MALNTAKLSDHFLLSSDIAREVDMEQDTCVREVLSCMQTYRMEFDVVEPIGKLPKCFQRELGDAIAPYVILRDPNKNEFEVKVLKKSNEICFLDGWIALKDFYDIPFGAWVTFKYVDPELLLIRLTTRLCEEVKYPQSNPPFKHLISRTGSTLIAGTSASPSSSVARLRPFTFTRTYVKEMTSYDISSGTLILPWYGFGESAFAFVYSDLILVDNLDRQFKCEVAFGIDGYEQFCCRISKGWSKFCETNGLVEGQKVRFCVADPGHHYILYVCVYPHIGIETTLSYPLSDGRQIPLYIAQHYFVKHG